MKTITLGKTGLEVTAISFGALPIQRLTFDEAKEVLQAAYKGGINYFDTARGYTDSEEKIGYALSDVRENIIISTKSPSSTKEGVLNDIRTSLKNLKTDYVDLLQLHNPQYEMDYEDENGAYAGLLEAKKLGLCRHIGVTQHSIEKAEEFVKSGMFETMQFPFSCLSDEREIELTKLCKEHNVGFIAMKAIAGGLITKVASTHSFISGYDNVVPIYGIQSTDELNEFLGFIDNPPILSDWEDYIKELSKEVSGNFCRGCGYCMPCPMGIEINWCNRMTLLLGRDVPGKYLNEEWLEKMKQVEKCIQCKACIPKCPYGLDIPTLLQKNLADYLKAYESK